MYKSLLSNYKPNNRQWALSHLLSETMSSLQALGLAEIHYSYVQVFLGDPLQIKW